MDIITRQTAGVVTFNYDEIKEELKKQMDLYSSLVFTEEQKARSERIIEAVGGEDVLRDIVDTPVSPELLPPDESGKITQKTEDILGSYDLHDFFLYYMLKYNMRPQKIYYYACVAFEGRFEAAYIKEKLCLFLRRFITSQFKRSCAPDFAKITDLCLADYHLPSDCSPQTLIHQLERIEALSLEDVMAKL